MVVFHTYLSLPEGKSIPKIPEIPLNPIKKSDFCWFSHHFPIIHQDKSQKSHFKKIPEIPEILVT